MFVDEEQYVTALVAEKTRPMVRPVQRHGAGDCPAASFILGRTLAPPCPERPPVLPSRGKVIAPRGCARPRPPNIPTARLCFLAILLISFHHVHGFYRRRHRRTDPPCRLFANGHTKSITLIPVSRRSWAGGELLILGRSAVGSRAVFFSAPIGPCSSIGRPSTSMMRPSVLGPTRHRDRKRGCLPTFICRGAGHRRDPEARWYARCRRRSCCFHFQRQSDVVHLERVHRFSGIFVARGIRRRSPRRCTARSCRWCEVSEFLAFLSHFFFRAFAIDPWSSLPSQSHLD